MGLFKRMSERSKRRTDYQNKIGSQAVITGAERPNSSPALDLSYRRTKPLPILTPTMNENWSLKEKDNEDGLDTGLREEDLGQECLLIGIDFGTTYSGVAWAYSKQPDDIKIVTEWNCVEFQNSDKGKAPTKIAYLQPPSDPFNDASGDGLPTEVAWGYGVEDANAAEWFKLLLLHEEDMSESNKNSPQIQKAKEVLQRAAKTPVQAVADYLRLLWNHAIASIEKDFGAVTVQGLRYKVVCTVPAVWTTRAVDRMRQAATEAGILSHRLSGQTTLQFVSEPEAAALATLEDLKARPNFKTGDTFVVCDAGGGTVDLISYKVLDTNPMVLAECVEGQGKLCGAVFLDQDFGALMEQLIGEAWNVPTGAIQDMMNTQWENGIKRGFEGQSKSWQVRLPYECIERGAPPVVTLSQGHIREIFDNVVSQIQELVNDQINVIEETEGRLPKAVVLVGGFGSCRYLFNTLKTENKHRGIDVYQSTGMKPWTSISRGAVLKALTNSLLPGPVVLSRILRCSYGTRFHTIFDPNLHLQRDKFWYDLKGTYYARNQMEWYLYKGNRILDAKPYSLPWRESVRMKTGITSAAIAVSIYTCDSHKPPSRRDATIKRSCIVETLNPLDISALPVLAGADGQMFKEIQYELVVSVIGAALEFSIMHKGERVGRSQIQAQVLREVYSEPLESMAANVGSSSTSTPWMNEPRSQPATVAFQHGGLQKDDHQVMADEWVEIHPERTR